jgi:hypothetical protein
MSDEEFLDPTDSVVVPPKTAQRIESLDGKTITPLDISKAKAGHLAVQGVVWLGLDAPASRGSARRGPRAARRSA